jgi:D-galactose 1-dehydrogenase
VTAAFDWRQEGPQTWDIEVETDDGGLVLGSGGAVLAVQGRPVAQAPDREYPRLYARMAELVARRAVDADFRPMILVADAFTLGRRREVAAFDW